MLIAEDLLLVLTDETTGKRTVDAMHLDPALGGAILLDLLLANKIALEGDGRGARVAVIDPVATDNRILDPVLELMATRGRMKPQDAVGRVAKKLRPRLYESLERRGFVRRDEHRILGILPSTRWPAQDLGRGRDIRNRMYEVLVHSQTPDERIGALIALVHAAGATKILVDKPDRAAAKTRALEISEGSWTSAAVRKAIQAAQGAVSG